MNRLIARLKVTLLALYAKYLRFELGQEAYNEGENSERSLRLQKKLCRIEHDTFGTYD